MKNHKYSDYCNCYECNKEWRDSLYDSWKKNIKNANKKTPGQQCPFCGTNPSKIPYGGKYFRNFCGHEIRKNSLVVGWTQTGRKGKKMIKCKYPEKTFPDTYGVPIQYSTNK